MTTDAANSDVARDRVGLVPVAFALFLLAVAAGIYAAWSRGMWLDEFWSLRLGHPDVPLAELISERWLRDPHPMLANALYRIAATSGWDGIGFLRLVLNLPAFAALLAATTLFTRASPSRSWFYIVLVILVCGLFDFVASFADLRSYFWQLCWTTIVLQLAYWLIAERDRPQLPSNTALTALAYAGVFLTISLHYVGGLIASVPVALLLLHAARGRAWRVLAVLATPAAIAWVSMTILAAFQYAEVAPLLDFAWIETTTWEAVRTGASVLAAAALANPAAVVIAVVAVWTMRGAPAANGTVTKRPFYVFIAASLAVSAAMLLVLNGQRPVVVDRYLISWQPMVCAGLAAATAQAVASSRIKLWAVVACSALSIIVSAVVQAREGNWNETRDFIARAVARCPGARVFAMSPWRLGSGYGTRASVHEGAAFADAYRRSARDGGFAVSIVTPDDRVLPLPAGCPALLWVEHSGGRHIPGADFVMARARLGFAGPVSARLFRSPNGFVLIASRRMPAA